LSEMQEVKLQAATNYFDKASTINKTRQQWQSRHTAKALNHT
jgi:hypothetical protein